MALRRLSPAVLVSLLGAGGGEVLAMWDDATGVDDRRVGGAVNGLEDGAGWMDHARTRPSTGSTSSTSRGGRGRPPGGRRGGRRGRHPGARPAASRWRPWPRDRARRRPGRRPRARLADRAPGRPLVVRRPPALGPDAGDALDAAVRHGNGHRRRLLAPVEPPPGAGAGRLRHVGRRRRAAAAVVDHVAIIAPPTGGATGSVPDADLVEVAQEVGRDPRRRGRRRPARAPPCRSRR